MIPGISPDQGAPSLWESDGTVVLAVEKALFPSDAVLAAGYRFTDRYFVWLETAPEDPNRYRVFVRPKSSGVDLSTVAGEFTNELIDQRLRQRLNERFGDVRAIIAAQAFAEGNLLHPSSGADPRLDPDGAARRR
ncbi:MAG: His-Xaa-Ser system protein HxsD [Acidobacteria bacterium]|nr:MAG: His-Xaa-Ser system protein HxsD [Acidobacteriota bacterium]